MNIPPAKKVVCITGSVWTGDRHAPRRILVRDGFLRPIWFTTGRPISDAHYEVISTAKYHLACSESKVLAHMRYGGDYVGILEQDFEDAAVGSQAGVLVAGFPEIIAQIAEAIPQAHVFALKGKNTRLSDHLAKAASSGQLRRLDIDVLEPGAWDDVHKEILSTIALPASHDRS